MANRYFTFDQLSEKETGIQHRAAATLGRHHFVVETKTETHIKVSGYNSDGSKAGETVIKRGGTLVYNRGSIWAIKPVEDMTPLERLRSEFRISKNNVFVVPEAVIANISNTELEPMIRAISEDNPTSNNNRFWGDGETLGYKSPHFAYTLKHSFHGGVDQRMRINRVFISQQNFEQGVAECRETLLRHRGW